MIAPNVTPALAERCLIGAAVHAFTVRVEVSSQPQTQTDLEFARKVAAPAELAESATAYAITLVWWAHRDLASRRELLQSATARMLRTVTDSAAERPYETGYRIFAERLTRAALAPAVHACEIDLDTLVSGVDEIDLMTARFADNAVSAVLRTDCRTFGDPQVSSERMRDEMIALAYLPRAA